MFQDILDTKNLTTSQKQQCLKKIIKRLDAEDPFFIPELYSKSQTTLRKKRELSLIKQTQEICVISNNWNPLIHNHDNIDMYNISLRFDINEYTTFYSMNSKIDHLHPHYDIINSNFLINAVNFFHNLFNSDLQSDHTILKIISCPKMHSWNNTYTYYIINKDILYQYFNFDNIKLAYQYLSILQYINIYRGNERCNGRFYQHDYGSSWIHPNDFDYRYKYKLENYLNEQGVSLYIQWIESNDEKDEYLLIRNTFASWRFFYINDEKRAKEIYMDNIRLLYRIAYFYDEYKKYLIINSNLKK
ncbi:MAG: hypothetical protein PHP92_04960 [Candidatus Nanoarchaeia archaeon]|nr:hypothetical protein [Candidatus Nanoarchaeia archaeon]